MTHTVDLRSDTVTQPTEAMREAMARAEVGDDVYGEDPTVARLEALAASMLGVEAALFCPSGTMANLVAVLAQTAPGDLVVVGRLAHLYINESGWIGAVAGVVPWPVDGPDGAPTLAELEALPRGPFAPPPVLLCLENTHNFLGGTVLPPARMDEVTAAAHARGWRVHLDGARLFNAAVALGVPAARLARGADSVMVSLSKGLSAPVGSLLGGSAALVARARQVRKRLGGGMRQVGVLAAAGIVALETMVARLAEDHATARALARGLRDIPGLDVDLERVQTNMVMVEAPDAPQLVQRLAARGVLVHALGPRRLRLVTHRHVTMDDVGMAVDAFRAVMRAG